MYKQQFSFCVNYTQYSFTIHNTVLNTYCCNIIFVFLRYFWHDIVAPI